MANRKKRTKKGKTHDFDLKRQKKNIVSDKERTDILKDAAETKPKDVNQNFRPANTQGLRRGDR